MDNNDFRKSRNFIIEDDNSLLMFEHESITLVRKYRESIIGDVSNFIYNIITYGRMKRRLECSVFGQINTLTWTYYPSEGRECKLLVLGDKIWIKGKIKAHGELTFSLILEELSRSVDSKKQSLETRRFDEYSKLREELKSKNIDDFQDTYQINTILEFIPETIEPQEPESPLDDIRKMIRENQT